MLLEVKDILYSVKIACIVEKCFSLEKVSTDGATVHVFHISQSFDSFRCRKVL